MEKTRKKQGKKQEKTQKKLKKNAKKLEFFFREKNRNFFDKKLLFF